MIPIFLAFLAGAASAADTAAAPPRLKVYISADMEGVAGLVANDQMQPSGNDYARGRQLMTAEVNAAIAGAFDAGATEVIVNDAHGTEMNLVAESLDRRAILITGRPKPLGMMQGIDGNCDAAVFIGYHAQAATADAILDHTYSGNTRLVRLNGVPVGEYGLNVGVAAQFGVPVVFVSGDRALATEVQRGDANTVVLAVKDPVGTTAAATMHPAVADEKIRQGVASALRQRERIKPRPLGEVELSVELTRTSQADLAMMVPGMRRAAPRIVSYKARDAAAASRMLDLISLLASADHQ